VCDIIFAVCVNSHSSQSIYEPPPPLPHPPTPTTTTTTAAASNYLVFTYLFLTHSIVPWRTENPFDVKLSRKQMHTPITVYNKKSSTYKACPESIQQFWKSRELVACPWRNLAASQWRPYCTSLNSHSPMGLVSQQWDSIDWACVLCDRHIHKSPHFQQRF
jgi:hypothetical protein